MKTTNGFICLITLRSCNKIFRFSSKSFGLKQELLFSDRKSHAINRVLIQRIFTLTSEDKIVSTSIRTATDAPNLTFNSNA